MNAIQVIATQTGVAFELKKDDILTIIDPMGQQVSDLVVFNRHDLKEKIFCR